MTTAELMYVNKLQCENTDMRRELESFRSGEKYRKLRHDYDMVLRGKDRRINQFHGRLRSAALCRQHG